jgi:hypothetical protein
MLGYWKGAYRNILAIFRMAGKFSRLKTINCHLCKNDPIDLDHTWRLILLTWKEFIPLISELWESRPWNWMTLSDLNCSTADFIIVVIFECIILSGRIYLYILSSGYLATVVYLCVTFSVTDSPVLISLGIPLPRHSQDSNWESVTAPCAVASSA